MAKPQSFIARRLTVSIRMSVQELRELLVLAEEYRLALPGTPVSTGIRALLLGLLSNRPASWKDASTELCLSWLKQRGYAIDVTDRNRRAARSHLLVEALKIAQGDKLDPDYVTEEEVQTVSSEAAATEEELRKAFDNLELSDGDSHDT